MDKLTSQHISPDWIEHYNKALDVLWDESVIMNADIYLLKRIAEFPFNLLWGPSHLCWALIANALHSNIIMIAWRILADERKDVLTLPKLRDQLFTHAKNEQSKIFLSERLKQAHFDSKIKDLIKQVRDIRHSRLAHFNADAALAIKENKRGGMIIPANRLMSLRDAINKLIDALSLDSGKAPVFSEYIENPLQRSGASRQPDIERMLDLVARNSDVLNMPEQQREFWPTYRDSLSRQELTTLNDYRRKFGMNEV